MCKLLKDYIHRMNETASDSGYVLTVAAPAQ